MITIRAAIQQILAKQPFIQELYLEGLVNTSALARKIKPEIEELTMKHVTIEAVLMSLRRYTPVFTTKNILKLFQQPTEMIVRSNLIEITIKNTDFSYDQHILLLVQLKEVENKYFIITEGTFQTTIIGNKEIEEKVSLIVPPEKFVSSFHELSSITIKLPEEVVPTTGVYYYILKLLAWEDINIIEVASTYTEFTIILQNSDIDRAFSVLNKALRK